MKFKANTRRRALEYEKDLVQQWKSNKTFEKSIEQRPKSNSYVFYDGPPFITGVPHHGTLLSSVVKDAIPRYQTMKGKRVERVWGITKTQVRAQSGAGAGIHCEPAAIGKAEPHPDRNSCGTHFDST